MDNYVRELENHKIFTEVGEKSPLVDGAQAFRLGSMPVQQANNGVRGR
jgi:hypothetical protein